ncbi:MAG: cytochrome c biogenesis protein CcsA [Candidatus Methanoperedens sp.]|nr:cytochrome c biogenesis protein CcsA [Candidatus Methanoperedens sp.]
MNTGNLLLYISFLSTCSAAVLMFTGRTKLSILLTRIAAASITLSVLLLAYAFVFLDFSLFYVWQRSSAELPVFYRLAAMLVGQEGTYLVWAWLSLLVALLYIEMRGIHAPTALVNAYALTGCAFLLVLTITMTPFKSIFLVEGASLPSFGNGISPALVDILMPLHIFTVFMAYAFAIIPAAASLAYFTQREMPDVKNYLRLSWLFLGISVIAGGIWANYLLGWNGFWQWDPVQSTIMASWLLLTAALHADNRFEMGEYKKLFPILCISAFLGFLYTTLVARSGVYSSIHSFPETPTWWLLVFFMVIVFVFSLILALGTDVPASNIAGSIRDVFAPHNTYYFTILILTIMAFIALWVPTVYVILEYMGYKTIISMEFYNILFYPLIVGLSYLTGVCMLYGRVKDRTLAYIGIIYFAASFILSIAAPYTAHAVASSSYTGSFLEKILGPISITSYLPAFFFVTGNVIFKAIRDLGIKNKLIVMHLSGSNLIHLGFVFVVMGAILSTSFATTHHFNYNLNEKGVYKENGGIGMRFLDFKVEQVGPDWLQMIDVEVTDIEKYNTTAVFWKSRQFGFITRPAMRYGLLSDTQVEFQGSIPHQIQLASIDIDVERRPLASLMWGGCALLVVGVLLTLASNVLRRKAKKV